MVLADAVRAGFGAVRRSKRLLLLAALATGLLALPAATFVGAQVAEVGSRRPDATEIARTLDPDFFADVTWSNPGLTRDLTMLVLAALAMSFVLRPLLWGGYAAIAASRKRLRFATFVRDGGRVYWKYLRLSAIGVALLFALSLGVKPLLRTIVDFADAAPAEDLGRSRRWVAEGLAFLALCTVPMILDYTRVGIRMHRSPGVLAELGRSAMFVVQHPFRTTGFYLIGLVLEVAVCLPLAVLIQVTDGAYLGTTFAVLVLGQVLVAVREGCRLFHLAGAWRIREAEDRSGPGAPRRHEDDGTDLLEQPLPWHAR